MANVVAEMPPVNGHGAVDGAHGAHVANGPNVADVEMGGGEKHQQQYSAFDPSSKSAHDDGEQNTMSTMLEPVFVNWKNLYYAAQGKSKRAKIPCVGNKNELTPDDKIILDHVSGEVVPGQMLAIMGASGAGKTTLLNLLAGRLTSSRNVKTGGQVLVNGRKRHYATFKKYSAYVEQNDDMFAELTVEEQIHFSANLRLPSSYSRAHRRRRTDEVITELGLRGVKDSAIGNSVKRGVSGGERRRVNIGTELVTNPSLLFLDEPTSGLDAFNALNVMHSLRQLAHRGRTIISTIHQPRSNIFQLFDQLLLLSRGKVMYSGPAAGVTTYFAALGYPAPSHFNPADFAIDLVSPDYRTPAKEEESVGRIDHLAEVWRAREKERAVTAGAGDDAPVAGAAANGTDGDVLQERSGSKYSTSWPGEFGYLCVRTAKLMLRQKESNITRLSSEVFTALLLGLVWLTVGYDYYSSPNPQRLQALVGVLFFTTINVAFSGSFGVLFDFPVERVIVLRERSSGTYRVSSYFLAKTIVEIPRLLLTILIFALIQYWMIGFRKTPRAFFEYVWIIFLMGWISETLTICITTFAKDAQVASAIVPVFIIVSFLFAGFFIDSGLIPVWLRWLQYVSFIKYGITAAVYSQYGDDPVAQGVVQQYSNVSRATCYVVLIAILVVLRLLGYVFLRINGPKFDRKM